MSEIMRKGCKNCVSYTINKKGEWCNLHNEEIKGYLMELDWNCNFFESITIPKHLKQVRMAPIFKVQCKKCKDYYSSFYDPIRCIFYCINCGISQRYNGIEGWEKEEKKKKTKEEEEEK